jgi:amidohydrolase
VVAEALARTGLPVTTAVAGTGVVATVDYGTGGPHILVRADMDALPTEDLKSVPYRSTVAGVAHACGHDVHTTVVLGVAQHLSRLGFDRGRVTFVFQPAEEIPFGARSGGQAMIDAGVVDSVDVVLGLHCWPSLAAGTIGVDRAVARAAKYAFRGVFPGVGAHPATPSAGRDAVLAASQAIVGLHQVLGRDVDPGVRAALNVGTVRGGRSQSIVPPDAEITGTIRMVDDQVARRLRAAVERVVQGAAGVVGVDGTVEWCNEMPAVVNDSRLVQRALAVLPDVPSVEDVTCIADPPMTADDFALYAARRPGLYLKLGVADPAAAEVPPLHDGRFDVDERAIGVGVQTLTALVHSLLQRPLEDEQ